VRPGRKVSFAACLLLGAMPAGAGAESLYKPGNWPALASDRVAHQRGDVITILVYENASATNSANSSSKKDAKILGSATAGHFNKSAGLSLSGGSDSSGTTARSGQMVAQISVTIDGVEPNGDLDVSGQQTLHINRERTLIKIKGRLRPADISSTNTALSTRLADAAIDYDGSGFVSRSARQGVVARVFSWLGLL
jgi:flagellar L-ring protein FlgH